MQFDRVVRTEPLLRLQYKDKPKPDRQARDAQEIAKVLGAGAVLLATVPSTDMMELQVVSGTERRTGRVRIPTTPSGPTQESHPLRPPRSRTESARTSRGRSRSTSIARRRRPRHRGQRKRRNKRTPRRAGPAIGRRGANGSRASRSFRLVAPAFWRATDCSLPGEVRGIPWFQNSIRTIKRTSSSGPTLEMRSP